MTSWITVVVAISMLSAAIILGVIVLVQGDESDALNLASAIAGGLIVAMAVTFWEVARRRQLKQFEEDAHQKLEEDEEQRRRAIQRVLTTFAGAELSNIAASVHLIGVDENGEPVELFADINEAMRAFDKPAQVQKVLVEIGSRASGDPDATLTFNVWDCVERFYIRIGQQFDQMLRFFIEVSDKRALDAFLDLWRLQRSHTISGQFIWAAGSQRSYVQDIVGDAAPKAAYLHVVVSVLHAYEELLKAVEAIPSGIPSKRSPSAFLSTRRLQLLWCL